MKQFTKGEINRRQKWAEYDGNIIRQLTDYGLEAKSIDENDEKYRVKIEQWRKIVRNYQQRFGAKTEEIPRLNNNVLRSWLYAGIFGESRYGQGLADFSKDCDEYDTLYIISGLTVKDSYIKIEIQNALKFCQTVIAAKQTTIPTGENRLRISELSGYFFWNAKKNKVLYYEVDMGTQTWYFGA